MSEIQTLPNLDYNKQVYDYLKEIPNARKKTTIHSKKTLGEGQAGKTYVSTLKKFPDFEFVLKKMKRNNHADNELEALIFLRDKMLSNEIPAYYVFLYGNYSDGVYKFLMMEKVDRCLDHLMCDHYYSTKWYLDSFRQIAKAVGYLEKYEFNHGDLWNENVMIKWHPNQEGIKEKEKTFDVKFIDFDSAFKNNSLIRFPSLGGGENYRKKFYLGYDLNRYFDAVKYSHDSYIRKRGEYKRKMAKKLRIPIEEVDSDSEIEEENIIFPQEVVDFMVSLPTVDPETFDGVKPNGHPELSAKNVLKLLDELNCEAI